jgi:hypothetical protein
MLQHGKFKNAEALIKDYVGASTHLADPKA